MANPLTITAITGGGAGSGSFTCTAAAISTIADTDVAATSYVTVTPSNAAAGLLLRTKTCWVDTIAAGSFLFNVSASGAGAPAGTETFNYVIQRET